MQAQPTNPHPRVPHKDSHNGNLTMTVISHDTQKIWASGDVWPHQLGWSELIVRQSEIYRPLVVAKHVTGLQFGAASRPDLVAWQFVVAVPQPAVSESLLKLQTIDLLYTMAQTGLLTTNPFAIRCSI